MMGEGEGTCMTVETCVSPAQSVVDSLRVTEEEEALWREYLVHLQKNQKIWAPYNRNSTTWGFYVLNEPNVEVDVTCPQTMRCFICHSVEQAQSSTHTTTRSRKGIMNYNPTNGVTAMRKHVANEHAKTLYRYEIERKKSIEVEEIEGRSKSKKRKTTPPSAITEFFGSKNPYKNNDPTQQRFLEDLVLYITKGYRPLSSVENPWLRRLVMRQRGKVTFPSRKQFVDEVIPSMVSKTMERYVLPSLASCMTATATFDLWMSRAGFDTFALVINFIDDSWVPRHITAGLFEVHDTAGAAMARQVKELLASFNLTDKIVAYVKDEGANLGTLIVALTSVVSCVPLQLLHPYEGTCFGHAMSKACQYATNDAKVCVGMKEVSLKDAQAALQKTITWTKKSGKGRQEWAKACKDAGLRPRKLKTPVKTRFASKVILFEETLEFRDAINLCYGRQSLALQSRVPSPQTWAAAKAVTDTLKPVVHQCIMNQSRGHWLLSDALAASLSMCMKMQRDYAQRAEMNPPLQLGDFDSELEILCARMQAEVVSVLHAFLSFAISFLPDKAHNMLAIMLDPRYKGLNLISEYVGKERAMQVVAQYDSHVVIPLLITVFKHLNPSRCEIPPPENLPLENSLFGATASNEEATIGLLKSELSMYHRLIVNPDECKCALGWWKAHQVQFPNVAFLARQILGIVGSQIETERIFSIARIITSLRRCRLGIENLDNLVLILKNWPDDVRIDCNVAEQGVKEFLMSEDMMIDDNEDLIADAGLFEDEDSP